MKKIKAFLITILIGIVLLDIIWMFFPDYISRNYAIVITVPIITLFYFLYVEVKNILYLLALTAFIIADYCFFIEKSLSDGIVGSGVALSLYGVIVLRQAHYISTRRLLVSTLPFLAIYMFPFVFFVEKINDHIFGEVIFYTFAIGYFSFMSIMTYLSRKNSATKKLLLAGIATAVMGALFGTYLFIDKKPLYSVLANIFFVFSHYKMWEYIIIKDTAETTEEV